MRIGIIGDHDQKRESHPATENALRHAGTALGINVSHEWLPTAELEEHASTMAAGFNGLWAAPGTYESSAGGMAAIRHAREHRRPFLGTCSGFQHVVLEFARNVLGFVDVEHAETNPYASRLFVSELSCSLFGMRMGVNIQPGTRAHDYYGEASADEEYRCDFGMNEESRSLIEQGGLAVSGVDDDGEARIVELPAHPFYIATLFVPQMRSTPEHPHPIVVGMLEAARDDATKAGSDPLSRTSPR